MRLAADRRIGALGFTGSRRAGLKLKAAADKVGKPIYVELSSLNPVLIFPGALAERGAKIVEEFTGSCLMATGQFCTSPSLIVLFAGEAAEQFIAAAKQKLEATPPTPLLSAGVQRSLADSVKTLRAAGAELVSGGSPLPAPGYQFANTLLRVSGEKFLAVAGKIADGGLRQCLARGRRARRGAGGGSSRTSGRQSDRLHLFGHTRFRRRALRPARAVAAQPRRASAQRQDAHGRRGFSGDEPRRAVSGDGSSGIHRRRNSRVVASFCHAPVFRQRASAPPARRASQQKSERQNVAAH